MNANTMMTRGNLALKFDEVSTPHLSVVIGGKGASEGHRRPSTALVVVATVIVFAALVHFGLDLSASQHAVSQARASVRYETVTVSEGESLWSIAESHRTDGLTTQETSDLIRSENHLVQGGLRAGASLKVPVSR